MYAPTPEAGKGVGDADRQKARLLYREPLKGFQSDGCCTNVENGWEGGNSN